MDFLRKITTEDCDLIFAWANDPLTRRMSFNNTPIPYEDHVSWFRKKLYDNDCYHYILMHEGSPAGSLRLERSSRNIYEISYNIAPEFRGRGLGSLILSLAAEKARQDIPGITGLRGEVKKENTASCRCFLKNGYRETLSGDAPDRFIYSLSF